MGFLDYFTDWAKKTATIKELTTSLNASGQVIESETTIVEDLVINWWTDVSNETNVNDKFVDQATGRALIPPEYSMNTKMWMEIDSEKYYIIGVDNVAGFGEFTTVDWRREYA